MLEPANHPGDLLDLLHPVCQCPSGAGEPHIVSSAGWSQCSAEGKDQLTHLLCQCPHSKAWPWATGDVADLWSAFVCH